MNILVFDIETVPDTELGTRLYGLDGLSDDDVARAMRTQQVQKTGGSDFLPCHQHKIVAISALLRSEKTLKLWSLGNIDSKEQDLVARFFSGVEKYTPVLVSWNGAGFDLPVLHYRSLLHGVNSSKYWEHGENDTSFRYNSYLSRYHWRHIDIMDILSGFNLRAAASLDAISVLLGFPGKQDISGSDVWETYLKNDISRIRNYCETDVLNTYLIFLRWELISGKLTPEGYTEQCEKLKSLLQNSKDEHLIKFSETWNQSLNT